MYRIAVCVRAYRKFTDVYDYDVSARQIDDARQRLVSALSLSGVSFANGQQLSNMFLARLQ